jgi:hypothetical protein
MDAFEILVLMLSVMLAMFLLLAIVFGVLMIRIAKRVHEITEKARAAADSVEVAAKIFQKSAGPAVFSRIIANIVEAFQDKKKGRK